MTESHIYLIVIGIAIIMIFTVGRLLVLWFFQIEKRVNQNSKIIELLKEMVVLQKKLHNPETPPTDGK